MQCLYMSIQVSGSDDLFVQAQSAPAQASSQRHVGFGQETEGYSTIQLYSMIRRFFMVFLQDQMFDICK